MQKDVKSFYYTTLAASTAKTTLAKKNLGLNEMKIKNVFLTSS